MNPRIERAVNNTQTLNLKINVGPRYRIMKEGMRGSLWLMIQTNAFFLKLTGEVLSKLKPYMDSKVGKNLHEDQGYPVWYLPLDGTMEDIVMIFDNL